MHALESLAAPGKELGGIFKMADCNFSAPIDGKLGRDLIHRGAQCC